MITGVVWRDGWMVTLSSPVIDYHTVGEDIITASNTVDNDETHADSNPSVERETNSSCSGEEYLGSFIIMSIMTLRRNWRMSLIFLIGIVGALSRNGSMNVMRAINGVMMRIG